MADWLERIGFALLPPSAEVRSHDQNSVPAPTNGIEPEPAQKYALMTQTLFFRKN